MILTDIFDKNGKEVDTGKVYYDVDKNVRDIHIATRDGIWVAEPSGLDAEKLLDACKDLIVQN